MGKAKEYVLERVRIIETLNDSNLRLKNKNSYYLDCYDKWRKHAEKLEKKVKAQQEEIKNLLPSKAKTNAFTELCKNYEIQKKSHLPRNTNSRNEAGAKQRKCKYPQCQYCTYLNIFVFLKLFFLI